MYNPNTIVTALRARLATMTVCTTGSVTLAATVTGFTRTTGSFVTDGFVLGMELTASGFTKAANTGVKVITAVTALTITCEGCVVEGAGAARTIRVVLPSLQAKENSEPTDGIVTGRQAGRPYYEEQFPGGGGRQMTVGGAGDHAELEFLLTFSPRVHVQAGIGREAAGAYATALLALFPPGYQFTGLGASEELWVLHAPIPYPGQLLTSSPGFAFVPVTVPLGFRTPNSL